MATKTTRRTATPTKKRPPITSWFSQWLSARDTAATFGDKQDELRVDILDAVTQFGDEDDKGNIWYQLPKPVEFTDRDGKKFVYTVLKRERHLTPREPLPDAEKSQALLEKKNLWLSEAQQKQIAAIQMACPYAVVSVQVDADAVAGAYFKDIITEAEYDSILGDQRETFQFRPAES
jgi:hypothetical protein